MRFSKVVKVGDVLLGGGNKIAVQSMTNTRTADTDATIKQIRELEGAGCDIVRVAVLDLSDAEALKKSRTESACRWLPTFISISDLPSPLLKTAPTKSE